MAKRSFRKANAELGDELKKAGIYNETIMNLVDQLGILGPRASARDGRFVFQTLEGEQRTPDEIVRRLSKQPISMMTDENGEILLDVGDFINEAKPNARKKGIFQTDIKGMTVPNKDTSAWTPQTMSGLNPNDLMHVGRFTPELTEEIEHPNLARARAIGRAEATGDNKLIHEANTMYDFSYEDAQQVGDSIRIGDKTLSNFLAMKGITADRVGYLIDPASGRKYIDMSKEEQASFRRNRGIEGTRRWMNMGGRSVGDGGTEVVVPGFAAQMEHQKPFTGSIDVLGQGNSTYLSDDKYNQAGYLERYENAEKNDIDTIDYHRMRRAQMLSLQQGTGPISLSKGVGQAGVEEAIADAFPAIDYTNSRLKENRKGSVNLDNTQKGLELMRLTSAMYN